jgi:hypothetical protein
VRPYKIVGGLAWRRLLGAQDMERKGKKADGNAGKAKQFMHREESNLLSIQNIAVPPG